MALNKEDRPLVAAMASVIYGARILTGRSFDETEVSSEAIKLLDSIDRHMPNLLRRRAMDRRPMPKAREIDGKGRF